MLCLTMAQDIRLGMIRDRFMQYRNNFCLHFNYFRLFRTRGPGIIPNTMPFLRNAVLYDLFEPPNEL